MENKVTADYLDEDGCLHCGTCGKRKQMKVSLMGFEHVVSCLCECEVKARQELDEKMQWEEAQRQLYQRKIRRDFGERRFWGMGNLKMTMGSNQKILIARQYVENWTDMKRKKCRIAFDGTSWNREKFLCRLYCKCTFGTGRTCHDDKIFSRILNEMTSYQAR